MTDHKQPLVVNGIVLHRWLLAERRRLADRLVHQFSREIPVYAGLSESELQNIAQATAANLELFARSLRSRVIPEPAELVGPITDSAGHRAGESFPLDGLLAAYSTGMLEVWRTMVGDARPEDFADVLACTELALGYIQRSTTAVAATYLEERRRMDSDEQHRRYALLSALLRGEPSEEAAARAGVHVPDRYLVLSLSMTGHPDELGTGRGPGQMAGQRKVYRATETLRRVAGEGALSLLDPGGGTVLLPATRTDGVDTDAAALVAEIGAATGVDVHAAGATAAPVEVAAAAQEAAEVLELAVVLGRPPGLYRMADVLLEYQLTRPSAARAELGRLLDPLDGHPDLLDTLATHLRTGLDRRRTARELHLHPNTVDYRIRRATALTGLDPADPAQLQRIGAALVVRRLAR